MNKPSRGYHDLVFGDRFGDVAFLTKCRIEGLRDLGPCLSPFNSFLFLQGLETLGLRMARHSENALALAEYLERHPFVEWVKYPGLASSPYYELGQRSICPGDVGRCSRLASKVGCLRLEPSLRAWRYFLIWLISEMYKSLVLHPASTTHQQLPAADLEAAGVSPDMIRVSVGLEGIEDLIRDAGRALDTSQSPEHSGEIVTL